MNNADQVTSYSEEIKDILEQTVNLPMGNPGVVIETCMGLMARCTEIHIHLSQMELRTKGVKSIRVMELQPVMTLIEFIYKGASRLTEVYRQELEMSK